jgi:DNA-binding XRE family transcriptional regulator
MISGRQIRAARALLEWSGVDLAKKSGLTQMTISNIESDKVQPNEDSLQNILTAFDKNGIEFTEGEGVRLRKNEMRIFAGKTGYRQMLDHIYKVMKEDGGGRICQIASDAKYLSHADDYAEVHIARMAALPNIDARVLTLAGDDNFPASYCTYHWLPKKYAALAPSYVYNDYIVLPMHESARHMELASIHSKMLTEKYVEQFELFWKESSVPQKKRNLKR